MPGQRCSVSGCSNVFTGSRGKNLSYHRFPSEIKIRQKWIKACGSLRNNLNLKCARICSEHFTEQDFQKNMMAEFMNYKSKKLLIPSAIPSINLSINETACQTMVETISSEKSTPDELLPPEYNLTTEECSNENVTCDIQPTESQEILEDTFSEKILNATCDNNHSSLIIQSSINPQDPKENSSEKGNIMFTCDIKTKSSLSTGKQHNLSIENGNSNAICDTSKSSYFKESDSTQTSTRAYNCNSSIFNDFNGCQSTPIRNIPFKNSIENLDFNDFLSTSNSKELMSNPNSTKVFSTPNLNDTSSALNFATDLQVCSLNSSNDFSSTTSFLSTSPTVSSLTKLCSLTNPSSSQMLSKTDSINKGFNSLLSPINCLKDPPHRRTKCNCNAIEIIGKLKNWRKRSEKRESNLRKRLRRKDKIIGDMKYKLFDLTYSNHRLKNQIKGLNRRNILLEKQNSHFQALLGKVFTPCQMRMIMGKRKVKWGDDDLANAFALRYLGKPSYIYLREKLHYPLPHISTLKRYAAKN